MHQVESRPQFQSIELKSVDSTMKNPKSKYVIQLNVCRTPTTQTGCFSPPLGANVINFGDICNIDFTLRKYL